MIHSHYQPRPSKPTIDLGGTCHHQAWYLRRLMSMYNDITRRVHLPRELAIRRIMAATGVDLSLYGPSSCDTLEETPVDGDEYEAEGCEGEECQESEGEKEDDPCCSASASDVVMILCIFRSLSNHLRPQTQLKHKPFPCPFHLPSSIFHLRL